MLEVICSPRYGRSVAIKKIRSKIPRQRRQWWDLLTFWWYRVVLCHINSFLSFLGFLLFFYFILFLMIKYSDFHWKQIERFSSIFLSYFRFFFFLKRLFWRLFDRLWRLNDYLGFLKTTKAPVASPTRLFFAPQR